MYTPQATNHRPVPRHLPYYFWTLLAQVAATERQNSELQSAQHRLQRAGSSGVLQTERIVALLSQAQAVAEAAEAEGAELEGRCAELEAQLGALRQKQGGGGAASVVSRSVSAMSLASLASQGPPQGGSVVGAGSAPGTPARHGAAAAAEEQAARQQQVGCGVMLLIRSAIHSQAVILDRILAVSDALGSASAWRMFVRASSQP